MTNASDATSGPESFVESSSDSPRPTSTTLLVGAGLYNLTGPDVALYQRKYASGPPPRAHVEKVPVDRFRQAVMKPSHWYIKGSQLFEKLSDAELAKLETGARIRSFAKGSPIYLPAEPASGLFLLGDGRVQICHLTPDGRKAIIAFIEPGELFGEMVLVGETRREEFAEAVLASTVIWLPTGVVESLMESSPAMSLSVTKLIGLRRVRIERRLRSLLFRSNRDRLVHLLLELVDQYGNPEKDGVLIALRLSHQDLASIIGSTRETVTLLLGQLQLEGLLRVSRQRILVRSVERLKTALDPDGDDSQNAHDHRASAEHQDGALKPPQRNG